MENYDIIMIGGGASGLAAAIMAKTEEKRILIIEHNDRVGKKILSTGNGKCNLTNLYCGVDAYGTTSGYVSFAKNPEGIPPYYSSGDLSFAQTVIRGFNAQDTVSFFWDLGMIPLEKNGYVYPRSEQASAVLDLLRFRAEKLGVEYLLGYQPMDVTKTKEGFLIDGEYACRKLVLATGGRNASKTGSDGSGYEIAKRLGHRIVKPLPALCALICSEPFFKELKGVRTDAELSLFDITEEPVSGKNEGCEEKTPLMTVFGNLQMNETGISGIPVFQLSLLASRLLDEGRKLQVKINFLPEMTREELEEHLSFKTENKLLGVLNKKLAHVIEKEGRRISQKKKDEPEEIALSCLIRGFKVHPVRTASFEEAQTTLGGVSTEEIDPETMESKLVKGLYFTGEIVDVSGICGGYNLQWAWSTAHAAARGLRE